MMQLNLLIFDFGFVYFAFTIPVRMFNKTSLAFGMQKSLRNTFASNDLLSDFTVLVEDTIFECHKVILNTCSGFFRELFVSNTNECQEKCVTIHGMTKETFALILNYVYNGVDYLTEVNVLDVWAASVQLQIEYMIKECEYFVIDMLSKENCCVIYSHAKLHSSKRVMNSIHKFMCENFEVIKHDKYFLELNADDVYEVIKSNNLRAESEDSVVECISEWVQYVPDVPATSRVTQAEDRQNNAVKLFSAVRFYLVSEDCLKDISRRHRCIEVLDMILDAMFYKLRIDDHHTTWHDAAIYRARHTLQHVMIFLKGNKLMVYNLNTGIFDIYAHLADPRNASITVFDNVLYLNNCVSLKYFTEKKKWVHALANLACRCPPSQRNLLLSHESYIYCYDFRLDTLKRYNCNPHCEKKWEILGISMANGSIVKFKHFILLFSTERDIVVMQCFNTIAGKCVTVNPDNPIVGPTDNIVSFTDQKNVYILQRNGHFWKIISTDSSLVDFTFIAALWDFDWKIFGAVVYHQQLYIFGNEDNDNEIPNSSICSAPYLEIFKKVKIVKVNSNTQCLPMVIAL